jgi:DNA polymerase-3 subunit epsilon
MGRWLSGAVERRARGRLLDAPDLPDVVRRYAGCPFETAARGPIGAARLVVLDTEATGLDPAVDRPLTLAAVAVRDGSIDIGDRLELVFHGVETGEAATPIHGLVPADLAGGLDEASAMERFLEFVGGAVVVGHHVAFDVALLEGAARRMHDGLRIWNARLDTGVLARRLEHGPRADTRRVDSLDALCARYGVPIAGRHTAAGDALATATLLMILLARAREVGIDSLDALVR